MGAFGSIALGELCPRNGPVILGASDSAAPAPTTAAIAVPDSLVASNAWSASEWASLPSLLANPGQVLLNTANGKLVYVDAPSDATSDLQVARLAVELDCQTGQQESGPNLLSAALKLLNATIASGLANGLYEAVK